MNIETILNKKFNYDSKKVEKYKLFLFNDFDFDIVKIRYHIKAIGDEDSNGDFEVLWNYLNWLEGQTRKRIDFLNGLKYPWKMYGLHAPGRTVYYDPETNIPVYVEEPEDKTYDIDLLKLDELKEFIKGKLEYIDNKENKNISNPKNEGESLNYKVNIIKPGIRTVQWLTKSSDLFYWIKQHEKDTLRFENIKKIVKNNFEDQNGKKFIEFSEHYIQQGINNLLNNKKLECKSTHGKIIDDIYEIAKNEENIKTDVIASQFVKWKFIDESHKQNFIKLFKNIL